jgi:RNA polymerase sigma factor (sigma-70 family)
MQITAEQHLAIETAVTAVARRFKRLGAPVDPEEATQVGWRAALEALLNFDPKRGKLGGLLYTAVIRNVGDEMSRVLAVPSIGQHRELARELQTRVEIDDVVVNALVDETTPEDLAIENQQARNLVSWRIRVRREVERVTAKFSAAEREIVEALVDGGKSREIAATLGVEPKQVYRVRAKLDRHLKESSALAVLNRAREEIG